VFSFYFVAIYLVDKITQIALTPLKFLLILIVLACNTLTFKKLVFDEFIRPLNN